MGWAARWLCLALVVASPRGVRAQTAPVNETLSLPEALRLARRNNRALAQAQEALAAARAQVTLAFSALSPKLEALARFTYNHPRVSVALDGRDQGFNSLVQSGLLADLSRATGAQPGAYTRSLVDFCAADRARFRNRAALDSVCRQVQGSADDTALSTEQVDRLLDGYNNDYLVTPRTQLDGSLQLSVPLVVPAAYPAIGAARRALGAQAAQVAVTEAQVLRDTALAFYAAAGADQTVAATRYGITIGEQTLTRARARASVGLAAKIEIPRAEHSLLATRQQALEADDARRAAYAALRLLTGRHGSFTVVVPPDPPADPRSHKDLREASAAHPQLTVLARTEEAARLQARSALLGFLPTLSLFGTMNLTNATGFARRHDYYAAGLELQFPLWDGFDRWAKLRIARAEGAQAALRMAELRESMDSQLDRLREQLVTKRRALELHNNALEVSDRVLNIVRAQHEAGLVNQLDLLVAQEAVVQERVAVVQSRLDFAVLGVELDYLTGRLAAP